MTALPPMSQLLGDPVFLGVALGVQVLCFGVAAWALRRPASTKAGTPSDTASGPAAGPTPKQLAHLIATRRSVFPKGFAANWAPTHRLTEPWRFVVLGGKAKEEFEDLTIDLCRRLLSGEKQEATLTKLRRKKDKDWTRVGVYIALAMKVTGKVPEEEELCALAAAVQNMWLTASCVGVAGYWSSWQPAARDAPDMATFLGLGAGERLVGVFVAGVPGEGGAAYRGARRPWQDKVQWRLD